MSERDSGGWRMLAGMLQASHLIPLELVPAEAARGAAAAGLRHLAIYLVDVQAGELRLLSAETLAAPDDARRREGSVRIKGSVPGRAFQFGQILAGAADRQGRQWWVPLLDGTERLGVLRMTTEGDGGQARGAMQALASLLALIIVSKRDRSDSYARLVRAKPMNVAAEMQWQLMPPQTYADDRVVIAAAMEPAYEIAGDAYDYALAGPAVYLSVFDAMGHDTTSGLSVSLAMGTCRNARRQGSDLAETSERIEETLREQFSQRSYVTGVLARLDTHAGTLSWVNRGHHPPVVIRGGRWITHLRCPPAHPMGTGLGLPVTVCQEQLEPGDRLVFYTDGITEARRGQEEFGLPRFIDFLQRHHADGFPVPETLRRLMQAVMEHHDGRLQDDATVLFCEWLGLPQADRAAGLAGMPER